LPWYTLGVRTRAANARKIQKGTVYAYPGKTLADFGPVRGKRDRIRCAVDPAFGRQRKHGAPGSDCAGSAGQAAQGTWRRHFDSAGFYSPGGKVGRKAAAAHGRKRDDRRLRRCPGGRYGFCIFRRRQLHPVNDRPLAAGCHLCNQRPSSRPAAGG
jgi:hypothetical protein